MGNGRHIHAYRSEGQARHRCEEEGGRALRERARLRERGQGALHPTQHREKMAADMEGVRKRGAAVDGREAGKAYIQPEGRGREGRRRGRHVQVRCDGQVRHHVAGPAREMVQGMPRGRRRGAEAQAQGTAEGVRGRGKAAHARAAARAQGAAARGRGGVPKKLRSLAGRGRI